MSKEKMVPFREPVLPLTFVIASAELLDPNTYIFPHGLFVSKSRI